MSLDIVARLVRWHTAMADEPKRAESKRTKHRETADLIEQQAARIEELEKDAERYRYLRIHPSVASETLPSSYQRFWCLVELDADIDAARGK